MSICPECPGFREDDCCQSVRARDRSGNRRDYRRGPKGESPVPQGCAKMTVAFKTHQERGKVPAVLLTTAKTRCPIFNGEMSTRFRGGKHEG